jgi:hypothetical protein
LGQIVQTGISRWWIAAASIAFAGLFAFPLYKGMPEGLIPVCLGVGAAFGLRGLPAGFACRGTQLLYGQTDVAWLSKLVFLAVLVRIPLVLAPATPFADDGVYFVWAQSIATGHGFGRELLYPPGQSTWLALWMWAFGDTVRVAVAAQVLMSLVAIPLAFVAMRPCSWKGARWSALVVALYPTLVMGAGMLSHENTGLFLTLALIALFGKGIGATGVRAVGIWVAFGAIAGVAALVRPPLQAAPLLLTVAMWIGGRPWRQIATAAVTTGLLMAVVIAPWSIRSYRMYGGFITVSANAGRVLLSANHPNSDGVYLATNEVGAGLDPIRMDHMRRDMAIQSIRERPGTFVKRCVKRLAFMWGMDTVTVDFFLGDPPRGGGFAKKALSAGLQVFWAGFVTAWLISSRRREWWSEGVIEVTAFCMLLIGFTWVVHVVFEPLSRHHLPLMPLLAGILLPSYWNWLVRGSVTVTDAAHAAVPLSTDAQMSLSRSRHGQMPA